MDSVYPESRGSATADRGQRDGPRSFPRQIEAVKEAARIERVAADYGEFKFAGNGRLLGRCLSAHHEDRTPSFTIYPDEQRFKCYGCGERGDVLDLVGLVEGCELWEAMLILSTRYGIELPERPRSWFARQERQRPMRDKIADVRTEVLMRRLFRWVFEPMIAAIEDEEERVRVGNYVWSEVLPLAARMVEERRGTS